jgi:proteasome assembly chaperone (PAC2) family protein
MKLGKIKDIKAGEFTVFASLPDMGRVGGLVSSFLSQHLKTEPVAEIISSDKPWVAYGAGGYLREQVTGAPKVCGVVNKPELKKVLAKAAIDHVGNEITSITWFNGLILGLAAERGIDAIGLFGEIAETTVPQPLAAKTIISAFSKLEGISIDTKPLDRQYESILEEIQKKKKPSKFGPGIG